MNLEGGTCLQRQRVSDERTEVPILDAPSGELVEDACRTDLPAICCAAPQHPRR